MLSKHLPKHLPTPSPSRYRLAAATVLLVLCAGAAAAQAPLPAAIEEAASLSPLTLLALAGTLFAGAVAGAGVATWRHRRPAAPPAPVIEVGDVAVSADIVPESAVPKPAVPEPAVVDPEPLREDPPLAVFQRDGRGPETVGAWIDELASGIQARAVGLFADGGDDKVAAITRIADDARRLDHDVIIVDTDRSAGQLASAFDGRIGPRTGLADPFGALARIEIVPFAALFPRGYRPDDGDWSNAFVDLSARADLILVNLPAIEHWNAIRP